MIKSLFLFFIILSFSVRAEPLLVELFTSTNCPTCPAAEAKWAKLAAERPDAVMVVLQHVDYWNKNGVKPDPWALREVTERQYDYSNLLAERAGLVWTPQPVLDGAKAMKLGLFVDLDETVGEARKGMTKRPLVVQKQGDGWLLEAQGLVTVMAIAPAEKHPSLWRVVGMLSKDADGKVTIGAHERPAGNRWLVVVQAEAGGPITYWKVLT